NNNVNDNTAAGKFPGFDVNGPLTPILNEPNISNTAGTIAMAKGNGANTATSQFFFNAGDNSSVLDSSANAGGFTAFGQVRAGGQQVISAIQAVQRVTGPGNLRGEPATPVMNGADVSNFPAKITANALVTITSAVALTAAQRMTFSLSPNDTSNPAVATATVSAAGVVSIQPVAQGTTTVTIPATDLDRPSTPTPVP